MQTEITFSENTAERRTVDLQEVFQTIKPLQGLRQSIEKGDWDERLLGYEKYINRFSWMIIIASVIFLVPVCIKIFIR